jgi:hypothetical protein
VGLISCCRVAVALNAIPILVFINRLVTFRILGTMVGKCGPNSVVVFIPTVCMINFILYLSVEFLEKVPWEVSAHCNGLYSFPFFLFFAWI